MTLQNRRQFLGRFGVGLLAAATLPVTRCHIFGSDAPKFELGQPKEIARHPGIYYGWPTVGINHDTAELFVVASGGREAHVCPFGRVDMFRSKDLGETWTWPQTIYDGPTDDRDAGILVTSKGTILVTTFTSDGYIVRLKEEERRRKEGKGEFTDEQLARWYGVHNRMTDEERKKEMGCWMLRSTDNGINWSARYSTPINSPHGPIELSDGRLLYPGRDFDESNHHMGVAESLDDGVTWHILSKIPPRQGEQSGFYHELHGVEAADGTIIVQIRNHNSANDGETLQTESTDGGKTWSEIHAIGVWGVPSHLLKLKDGRLLMTYGYRRDPMGNQARVSTDNGRTWSAPIQISDGARITDVGYPSSVQLPDGSIVSVWYENMGTTCLRMIRWTLE